MVSPATIKVDEASDAFSSSDYFPEKADTNSHDAFGSQTNSVEGHWGSVSDETFPSNSNYEERIIIETETLNTDLKDRDQRTNLQTKIGASKGQHSDSGDIFDAPSFMTLVEPGSRGNDQKTASSEIQTIENTQQPNSSPLQAGWFPSLTHDAAESGGRKKNEEIIAKVGNWSARKQHMPLGSLLVEASLASKQKSPNALGQPAIVTPKSEASAQKHNLSAKTSPLVIAPKASITFAAKGDEKEQNTPGRLPKSKKEKKKTRGKWIKFLCCTSFALEPR
ncbi:hypothetical protein NE237_015318 [Protea cynaroides]|uniref:Uncharacterized protein n=1 Tax=Protea cynaroides TaxID=273540 RepID=A0A9Q0KDT0_9MAGN|nr:hypothetical protein NE237_015318 [Protea cynaroides]